MSVELAKAFCIRMMSDDSFREEIGAASTADAISEIVVREKYEFTKNDLLRVIGELMGKKVEAAELTGMVCSVYQEEIQARGQGSTEAVAAWLESLA